MTYIMRLMWMAALRYGPSIFKEVVQEFDTSTNPGGPGKLDMAEYLKDYLEKKLKENYNPSYTPPQGMPDADSKGEYPDTGNGSPVPPPMPDYTPDSLHTTDGNNSSYTPPPGMLDYDPNKPYDKYPNGGGTGSPQFPWDMESKRINFCKLRDNDCRCSINTV